MKQFRQKFPDADLQNHRLTPGNSPIRRATGCTRGRRRRGTASACEGLNRGAYNARYPPGSTTDPYQSVHDKIQQAVAQQLSHGGVLGLHNGMPMPAPSRDSVSQGISGAMNQDPQAIAHQAAGKGVGEVLSHAFGTMGERLDGMASDRQTSIGCGRRQPTSTHYGRPDGAVGGER